MEGEEQDHSSEKSRAESIWTSEDLRHYLLALVATYAIEGTKVRVNRVHFVPIEFLAWDCLTVGALGWGQIQRANANVINVNEHYSRIRNGCSNCAMSCLSFTRKRLERFTIG